MGTWATDGYERNEDKALGVVKSEAVEVSKIFKLYSQHRSLGKVGLEVSVDGETLEPLSDWEKSGLAGLLGVGYAIPIGGGGTRILFNPNYAMRPGIEIDQRGYPRESGSVQALSFTLGALF